MSPIKSNRGTRTALRFGLMTMAATSAMTRAFQVFPTVRSVGAFTFPSCSVGNTAFTSRMRQSCRFALHLTPAVNCINSRPYSTARYMSTASTDLTSEQRTELENKVKAKGDEIRSLKENGISKADLAPHVDELKALKAQLDPQSNQAKPKPAPKKQENKAPDTEESDYITSRSENYSKWYNDIIRVCGLAELSPVRGCMVIKPWGMSIWDQIHKDLDERIKDHGAENAYFPLLIPKSFLSKEAEHVDGFAKECAVVTHHRLTADPDGQGLIADPEAELEDPLIIRPTSETMIWHMFKKWIVSHR